MYCSNCGNPLDPNDLCPNCGLQHSAPQQGSQQTVYVQPEITEANLPEKFSPLGAWTYFWLRVLFGIPVIGFIFLIIFSFNDSNRNRRNFARSQWCSLVIIAIIAVIFGILTAVGAVSYNALINY